jgi:hypothetical protein
MFKESSSVQRITMEKGNVQRIAMEKGSDKQKTYNN